MLWVGATSAEALEAPKTSAARATKKAEVSLLLM